MTNRTSLLIWCTHMKMNCRTADWIQAAYFGGAALISGWLLWDRSGWIWTTDFSVIKYESSAFFRHFHWTGGYVFTAMLFAFSLMAAISAILAARRSPLMLRESAALPPLVGNACRALALTPLLAYGYFAWYQMSVNTYSATKIALPSTQLFATVDRELFWWNAFGNSTGDPATGEVDWQPYLKDVELRLKSTWHRAVSHDGKTATIDFVLQKNHDDPAKIEVQSAYLVTVSGSEEFDSSVNSALMNTNFRPFPAGTESTQEFQITFDSFPKKQ